MSHSPKARSSDRFTSVFLANCRDAGPNVWAEAGKALETAHRARLPAGWTLWSVIILLAIVVVSIRVW
jgi:hypothetical protein